MAVKTDKLLKKKLNKLHVENIGCATSILKIFTTQKKGIDILFFI